MFANVFFAISDYNELQNYCDLVNRHLSKTDRKLAVNEAYKDADCVADAVTSDKGEPLQVLHLIDGEYDVQDYYAVYFPTVERPTLELQYTAMPYDCNEAYPMLHCDATPAVFAQFIDALDQDAFHPDFVSPDVE
ncbi:hypothetical protein YOLOSWAG_251 [Erwinia phage vB_EamM_Yoloswag]|uniref:Uncharacterized protein n=1 Tax=Erwinia phage vB_EamM_Yoloswag TaxID=1958956 RepID=A0A1S6L3G1_9CAUD|nr:hypothetical protein HOR66_gp251 [Erwinia phage vB_EamM_Yoloswag]AQT28725.1 hypothetical protein YOLOSWAG_251 [Erwinia phage vB_EamM_Yoloswag]